MSPRRRRGGVALSAAFLLCACTTEPERLAAAKVVTGVEIAPYATYEECLALRLGQRVGYRFKVEPAIAFNIHYREGTTVVLPVTLERTLEEDGDFTADRAQVYCLTWEAAETAAVLSYRVEPLPPRP